MLDRQMIQGACRGQKCNKYKRDSRKYVRQLNYAKTALLKLEKFVKAV